jgi:hypothetical protein
LNGVWAWATSERMNVSRGFGAVVRDWCHASLMASGDGRTRAGWLERRRGDAGVLEICMHHRCCVERSKDGQFGNRCLNSSEDGQFETGASRAARMDDPKWVCQKRRE